jgi:hypothetical protein
MNNENSVMGIYIHTGTEINVEGLSIIVFRFAGLSVLLRLFWQYVKSKWKVKFHEYMDMHPIQII